ncbi:Lysine-sensitive aspartokinase 3 [Porphyromonas cangingivalis]|uniref:Aspartokinase n=2 Tax=Porphyromonas cangingivalis TaxID=36874 RepID=A0A1T4KGI7_PORCN|nr:aspartate kinase [Porphyromonas cangingivalis]VEJ02688.1 Lysine-sensitive aspartokinase 3 [Porphyromonas cangingivalis]
MKFGGTSVGTSERIKEVGRLINDAKTKIVVLSAMGGVTNILVEICEHFRHQNPQGALSLIEVLSDKYKGVIDSLYSSAESRVRVTAFVQEKMDYIESFKNELFSDFEEKCVLALGELISTEMMKVHLAEIGVAAVKLPALDFMVTNKFGEPDLERISESLKKLLSQYPDTKLFLTEGYICRNAYAEIDNLKRGGSDYTASILGACIDAKEVQIWTDIDGMHNNDPRIVEGTSPVRNLHFDEAAELAYFGAKILHPTCIHPAKMQNVPVRLLYTMDPSAPGTLISNVIEPEKIKAVAVKDGITTIKVLSTRLLLAHGFLSRVFEVFERHQTPIDLVTTSEVAVTVAIDNQSRLEEILSELKRFATVSIDNNMSIICIAGDLNWKNVGFEADIIKALEDIPVRMISYGGSNHNVSMVIRTEDKIDALQKLSKKLFSPKK